MQKVGLTLEVKRTNYSILLIIKFSCKYFIYYG